MVRLHILSLVLCMSMWYTVNVFVTSVLFSEEATLHADGYTPPRVTLTAYHYSLLILFTTSLSLALSLASRSAQLDLGRRGRIASAQVDIHLLHLGVRATRRRAIDERGRLIVADVARRAVVPCNRVRHHMRRAMRRRRHRSPRARSQS